MSAAKDFDFLFLFCHLQPISVVFVSVALELSAVEDWSSSSPLSSQASSARMSAVLLLLS